jgi:hypothetical protein
MSDPTNWTDYVQAASWAAAAVTGMIGVWKFGQDNHKDRAQRKNEIAAREEATRIAERELEWRRANGAQLVLEKMEDDELAAEAMLMLDWDGREFGDDEESWYLEKDDVLSALRTSGDPFDDSEVFVRDAFDHLFWHLERIQHQIDVGLITLVHVKFPTGYLIAHMEENAEIYRGFLNAYSYSGVLKLWDAIKVAGLPSIRSDYERDFNLKQARQSAA